VWQAYPCVAAWRSKKTLGSVKKKKRRDGLQLANSIERSLRHRSVNKETRFRKFFKTEEHALISGNRLVK